MIGESMYLTERDRRELQINLDIEVIRRAIRENACPMYDGERYCHIYPEPAECPTVGKLIGNGYDSECLRHEKSLEKLMDMFRKNIEAYSKNEDII